MSQVIDLAKLMDLIGTHYTFTAEHYPALVRCTPVQRKAFAVSHSVHHMCKSIGKLATECEHHDHGGTMSDTALKEAVVKTFINSVKLAQELGMGAEELGNSVPEYMMGK